MIHILWLMILLLFYMTKFSTILLFLALLACSNNVKYSLPEQDQELNIVNNEVISALNYTGTPSIVYFNDQLEFFHIAKCHLSDNIIAVNRAYWIEMQPIAKFYTLLHENGHCLYRQPLHDDRTMIDSLGIETPVSIMHTRIQLTFKHPELKDYYINELKTK